MSDDDIGTVRWFGESWGAPINDPRTQIEPPTGKDCANCGGPIHHGDRGITIPYVGRFQVREKQIAYHLNCWLRELGFEEAWKDGAFQ